jgi:hypothetical protein
MNAYTLILRCKGMTIRRNKQELSELFFEKYQKKAK